jgi:tRNA 2-selenouridine synthase
MKDPKTVTISDVMLNLGNSTPGRFSDILDVRSPSEYAEDHLPGAINTPVLNDEQRISVGTVYKQVSAFDAKKIGAAMVAKNIAMLIEGVFVDKPKDWRPLVYCWRGGNRSGALATVLHRIGWQVSLLEGGYREYRRAVLHDFNHLSKQFSYRVIAGPTGSGKSQILQQLQHLGAQVLDLEALAKHKGSVLGAMPGENQPSQKYFDTLVALKLRSFDRAKPVYIESESKKVGACQVHDELIAAMRASPCIVIEASQDVRIDLLLNEYSHFTNNQDYLFKQLDCLIDLHGAAVITEWKGLAMTLQWRPFVAATLAKHYDPAYLKSMNRNYKQLPSAKLVALTGADAASIETASKSILRITS